MTKVLDWIVFILVLLGTIGFGLYGLFGFNLIEVIFRVGWLVTIIYALVGIAGLYRIYTFFKG